MAQKGEVPARAAKAATLDFVALPEIMSDYQPNVDDAYESISTCLVVKKAKNGLGNITKKDVVDAVHRERFVMNKLFPTVEEPAWFSTWKKQDKKWKDRIEKKLQRSAFDKQYDRIREANNKNKSIDNFEMPFKLNGTRAQIGTRPQRRVQTADLTKKQIQEFEKFYEEDFGTPNKEAVWRWRQDFRTWLKEDPRDGLDEGASDDEDQESNSNSDQEEASELSERSQERSQSESGHEEASEVSGEVPSTKSVSKKRKRVGQVDD